MILIPAYQAERSLPNVLERVLRVYPHPENIWVVDDGSSDNTALVGHRAGVRLFSHERNLGKGAALRSGFAIAIDRGYDFVLTLDADGQHCPEEIPKFLDFFASGKFDILIGTRKASTRTMPVDRFLSNFYSSLVTSIAAGKKIRDSQSGYRLLRVDLLRKLRLRSQKYETESEILLQAVRFWHARVGEVPIRVRYRGEVSHIHRTLDTVRFMKVVLQTLGIS